MVYQIQIKHIYLYGLWLKISGSIRNKRSKSNLDLYKVYWLCMAELLNRPKPKISNS